MNALRESSVNSMFWKHSKFGTAYTLSFCIFAQACHSCGDRDTDSSKQRRGSSNHAIIATCYRSVKIGMFFLLISN